MCDPISLTIAATTIAAAGSVMGGIQAKQQANYQAQIAQRNAGLAEQSAKDALDRGQVAEQQQYRRTAQLSGAQRAAMAANGIDPDSGSGAAIQLDTASLGAQDAQTIRENAMRETKGYEINAANYTAQAVADRQAGKGALIGGLFKAGSTILSGASQFGQLKAQGFGGTSRDTWNHPYTPAGG